jgi:hypothetical protein
VFAFPSSVQLAESAIIGYEMSKVVAPKTKPAKRVRRKGARITLSTLKGDPVAALVRVTNADLEALSLGSNRKFLRMIARSRTAWKTKGGHSPQEVRRRLSRPAKKRQPPS